METMVPKWDEQAAEREASWETSLTN